MKRTALITLFLGAFLLQGCGVLLESREDKLARQEREAQIIRESMESGDFKMDVTHMIPLQMAPRHVTNYSVTVKGNHINSHLPYSGRAWNVPYGGGHALNYESVLKRKCRVTPKHLVLWLKIETQVFPHLLATELQQ